MTATRPGNRRALAIPDDELQAIQAALRTLQEKLLPRLVDLDATHRRALPKMGAKTADFVTKTLGYVRAYPQFQPPFVDIAQFESDLDAVGTLRALQQPLSQLADMVDDSLLLSGSEAYAAALACYNAFKSAARFRQPGAALAAQDLAARFSRRPPRGKARMAPLPAAGVAVVPAVPVAVDA